MRVKKFFGLFVHAFNEWNASNAQRFGAAIAYFSIFAIAPLLIIALALGGMMFGEEAATKSMQDELETTLGEPVAKATQQVLASSKEEEGRSITATLIGFAVLIFGAAGVFYQLQEALNTMFKVPPKPDRTFWETVRTMFFSVTMVLGSGFLLLVSLVINAGLTAMSHLANAYLPGGEALWKVVDFAVSFIVVTGLFGLIYKLVPNVRMAWRDVWTGAALTSLLFTLGKFVLGWYLGRPGTTSTFGAAGSLVVILIWVYYSSQILLYGACFTHVYAERIGSGVEPEDDTAVKKNVPDASRPATSEGVRTATEAPTSKAVGS